MILFFKESNQKEKKEKINKSVIQNKFILFLFLFNILDDLFEEKNNIIQYKSLEFIYFSINVKGKNQPLKISKYFILKL